MSPAVFVIQSYLPACSAKQVLFLLASDHLLVSLFLFVQKPKKFWSEIIIIIIITIKSKNVCPEWLPWGLGNCERVGKTHWGETLNWHWNTLVQERSCPRISCAKRGFSANFWSEAVNESFYGGIEKTARPSNYVGQCYSSDIISKGPQ